MVYISTIGKNEGQNNPIFAFYPCCIHSLKVVKCAYVFDLLEVSMKSFFASKTNWLMIFLTLIGVLTQISTSISQNPHPDVSAILMMVVGVLGIVVRTWFTNTAIDAPVLTTADNMARLTAAAKQVQAMVVPGPTAGSSTGGTPPVTLINTYPPAKQAQLYANAGEPMDNIGTLGASLPTPATPPQQ
jgi:hypothetical protein